MNSLSAPRATWVAFLVAGVLLITTLISQGASLGTRVPDFALMERGFGAIAAGILLYLLSHSARVLRIAFMIADPQVPLRRVLQAHFLSSGASLLVPFKLGEVFRVLEIGRVGSSVTRGAMIVWLERVFDMLVILPAMAVCLAIRPSLIDTFLLPVAVLLFMVVLTIVTFGVFPENAEGLKLFIIRRYRTAWSVPVLAIIQRCQGLLAQGRALVSSRLTTLLLLTGLIWGLEVAALSVFVPSDISSVETLLLAIGFLFSRLLFRPEMYVTQVVQALRMGEAVAWATPAWGTYQTALQLSLVLVATAVFCWTFRERARAFPLRTARRWVTA